MTRPTSYTESATADEEFEDETVVVQPPRTRSFKESVSLWVYRYNLSTALYMLEPWERALFNIVVISILAYTVYGLYYSALHPLFERIATSYM
ncbi:Serine palmitoyltransferase small subunit A [Gracilariopsis chorda]|uniref:Serine palmitoyltransferase small subunit A n=1 Tax=Gracilariopsis chorda TaxID=448386 RepID=A0A2V3J435_9FLOR|nr:Serine palmitoyltransferase small subunit A [Gracilariopsis chorda]|eukprot:PXF49144.1 Serine palmitoyltransferase small subunit A [Gracilariopsis chorda]